MDYGDICERVPWQKIKKVYGLNNLVTKLIKRRTSKRKQWYTDDMCMRIGLTNTG